jgi:hypothetical protein
MTRAYKLGYAVFLSGCFFFGSVPASGAEQKADPAPKKAAKKTSTVPARKPAKSESTTPPQPEFTEDAALASFDVFTIEWMKKLSRAEEFRRTQDVKVTQSTEGFLAEYTGYLPHRYITIKKTESKDTPFVGILTYYEKTMQCAGKTKEEALQGPFQPAGSQQISEIFRFTRGKWEY